MIPSVLRVFAILTVFAAMPAVAQAPAPVTPPTKPTPPSVTSPAKPAPSAVKEPAKAPLLDINSASAEDLSKLKGIGDVRSAAIIKGRPYKGKDELVQKKVLPEGVYAGVKDQIIAKQK